MYVTKNIEQLPAEVQAVLNCYFDELNRLGGVDALQAFCVIGSAAMNDYYPGKSDIDFLGVTKRKLNDAEFAVLQKLHTDIDTRFKIGFDGYYLEERLLKQPLQDDIEASVVFDVKLRRVTRPSFYTVCNFQVKTASVFVYGDKPEFDVDFNEFLQQLHENLNTAWTGWVNNHALPKRSGWKLVLYPSLTEHAILHTARYLYILRNKRFPTKKEAGTYLLEHIGAEHKDIVQQALSIQRNMQQGIGISFDRYMKTRKAVKAIINTFNKEYQP